MSVCQERALVGRFGRGEFALLRCVRRFGYHGTETSGQLGDHSYRASAAELLSPFYLIVDSTMAINPARSYRQP